MNHQNEKKKKDLSDCGTLAGRWNISETADFHAQNLRQHTRLQHLEAISHIKTTTELKPNSISEHTACRSLMQTSYNSTRPHCVPPPAR